VKKQNPPTFLDWLGELPEGDVEMLRLFNWIPRGKSQSTYPPRSLKLTAFQIRIYGPYKSKRCSSIGQSKILKRRWPPLKTPTFQTTNARPLFKNLRNLQPSVTIHPETYHHLGGQSGHRAEASQSLILGPPQFQSKANPKKHVPFGSV